MHFLLAFLSEYSETIEGLSSASAIADFLVSEKSTNIKSLLRKARQTLQNTPEEVVKSVAFMNNLPLTAE